uniref:Uncharacterized protein n=1 Tax=viral metagenome TaxID=1070528 RepID=A0A6M3JBH0_9ZZZZ
MKENKFVRGDTDKKRFESIERVLTRFNRRLNTTIIGVIPPIPISAFIEVPPADGVLLRYIFPTTGRITKGCLAIEEYTTKTGVKFFAGIDGTGGGRHTIIETRSPLHIETLGMPIVPGDRLTFRTDTPELIRRVWIGLLYEMTLSDMGKETYMIEEFERRIEDASQEEETP